MTVKVFLVVINYLMIMPQTEESNLKLTFADFAVQEVRSQWGVTNDDVMGGVSTSKISVSEENVINIFGGSVSGK